MDNGFQVFDQQTSDHHLGVVRGLETSWNTLPPISRLPPEILSNIFREVRGDYDYGTYDDDQFWTATSYSEPDLQWISVSHVSRHWRSVAISDAHLWTDPPLKNYQWTMAMLERSGTTTMPAITLNPYELGGPVVNALKSHLARVSYLVLPRMEPKALRLFLSWLPREFPKLEALSINCLKKMTIGGTTHYVPDTSSIDEAVTFPEHSLRCTPNLRHLQLNGVVDWNSRFLLHLTTLSLSRIPDDEKPMPKQFKTMLESAPGLKRLRLTDVCPSLERNEPDDQATPVMMQHLEYLTIEGAAAQVIFFFRILAAPVLKRISIYTHFNDNFVSEFPRILAAMSQPYLSRILGFGTDIGRLELGGYEGSLYIRASPIPASERHIEPDERLAPDYSAHALTLCIESGSEDEDEDDYVDLMSHIKDIVVPALFHNLDWTGLSELDIADLGNVSSSTLASTFGTLSKLRIIIADRSIAPWLISTINLTPNGQPRDITPSSSTVFSFPGLRHLILGNTSSIPTDIDFPNLYKSLEMRHKGGTPITSIHFDWSPFKTWAYFLLKQYVSHIVINPPSHDKKVAEGDCYSPYNDDWYL